MAVNKVEICGLDTSKLPMMTYERSTELLKKISEGDEEARDIFIKENLRLVLSVIQRFSGRGEQMDDLFQVGCIGLLKAIANFDPGKEVRFSTYGVPMIAGEIRRYLRDNSAIRVSRSLRDTAYRVLQCREQLMSRLGREPTMEEIAGALELPLRTVSAAMDAVSSPVSLYEPVYTDGGDTLYVMDQISDKKNKEEMWVEHLSLSEAMKRLNDRERHIISLRFFEGKTQTEVADMIGISQAQVSRLEKNALKAMRGYLTA